MLAVQEIKSYEQMQQVLKMFLQNHMYLMHEDEWNQDEWANQKSSHTKTGDMICVVSMNKCPVALFSFDGNKGYLNLLDIAENCQSKGLGKAILYLLFCKYPNLGSITGCSAPESLLFWVRIGAYFEKSLLNMYYEIQESMEDTGEFPFFNFSLEAYRFKQHLIETNFFNNWFKTYGFNINNAVWC